MTITIDEINAIWDALHVEYVSKFDEWEAIIFGAQQWEEKELTAERLYEEMTRLRAKCKVWDRILEAVAAGVDPAIAVLERE